MLWGNDWGSLLQGFEGNDVLYGAGGSDTLQGGTGNDIYRFDRSSGADLIVEDNTTAGGQRHAVYRCAAADQLWFRKNGNDLVIDIMGTQDANGSNPTNTVTIQNHYLGTQYQVERFVSNDGYVMAAKDANSMAQAPVVCKGDQRGEEHLGRRMGGSILLEQQLLCVEGRRQPSIA